MKPRRERVNAVAKQLVNALPHLSGVAVVVVVGKAESIDLLKARVTELLGGSMADCLRFVEGELHDVASDGVYMSPDADEALDVSAPPPRTLIVGG